MGTYSAVGVLKAGAIDGLWAFAERTSGWPDWRAREPQRVLTTGATHIVQHDIFFLRQNALLLRKGKYPT